MHYPFLYICLFLYACSILPGCSSGGKDERMLAQVGDHMLYASELQGLIDPGTSKKDSAATVKLFVQNWINRQILIDHAIQNNTAKNADAIDASVKKYKNDLQLAAYEQSYIAQNLDTLITEKQYHAFYTQNQHQFLLNDFVVNVFYMKFDDAEKNLNAIGKEIKNVNTAAEAAKIEQKYSAQALNSYLEPDAWVYFNDLLREIPVEADNHLEFIKNNSFFETNADGNTYFVRIFGYKPKNEASPLNMVKDKIKTQILRNRSNELLEKHRTTILKTYNKNGHVENYTN